MEPVFISLVIFWILCMFGGAALGHERNRNVEGVVWPLLFGPLGMLIVALLEKRWSNACPYCRRDIPNDATRCCHCTASLMIAFRCPHCQKTAAVHESWRGRVRGCPECHKSVTIPEK